MYQVLLKPPVRDLEFTINFFNNLQLPISQACQLFMSVAVEQAGIDYHVVLAQNALQQCLDQPELQTEFICALVKQTSRHTQQRLGVQVKKAAKLVSLGTARVVSPAFCLTTKFKSSVPFFRKKIE